MQMKISIETNVGGNAAAPAIDRLLTRIVAVLEKGTGLKFDVKADGQTVRLAHKAKLLRRLASRSESIVYDASESGYVVFVSDYNGQVVDEIRGEDGFSYEANLQLAEKMAQDKAAELNIDPRYIAHETGVFTEPDI
jgi:hypothetical protein